MKSYISYSALKNGVVRIPCEPIERIINCMHNDDSFQDFIRSELFKKSIYYASPDLYFELEKYISGGLDKKEETRIKQSLIKYISRMSSRCTPYGLFASCSTVCIEDYNNLVVDNTIKTNIRLDMLALCNLWQSLQDKSEFIISEKIIRNSTIIAIGNHIRYISYEFNKNERTHVIKQLKLNPILKFVLAKTNEYISFSELMSQIISNFEIQDIIARNYIIDLVKTQILIGNLTPSVVGSDFIDHSLQQLDSCSDIFDKLDQIKSNLIKLNGTEDISRQLVFIENIKHIFKICGANFKNKYLFQLDSFRTLSESKLSSRIIYQITDSMKFLFKLPNSTKNGRLENFKSKFIQRYDRQEIPLLEALDPEYGIGYGMSNKTIQTPLIDDIVLPQKDEPSKTIYTSQFQKILLEKIRDNKTGIIYITDSDVNCFEPSNKYPTSMYAMFTIHEKATNGNYLIGGIHFSGSSAANLLGRFAYGSDEISKIVNEITINEQKTFGNDTVVAEIVHIPESRTGNILFRPHIRGYEIVYLSDGCNDSSLCTRIPLSDIYINIDNNKILLTSKKLNKRIEPRLTTAHNYSNKTTPIYQFLCDLQFQNIQPSIAFSWYGLESIFDHLPRVMYKDIILSYEKWIINSSEILDCSAVNFDDWRKKRRIHEEILLVSGDNKLYMNLKDSKYLEILFKEAKRYKVITFEEFIPCKGVVTDDKGNNYMNEFIIPFVPTYAK